ncbi:hypothetical protein E1A91_A01G047400v1, partial [Gossypium mustelinum]
NSGAIYPNVPRAVVREIILSSTRYNFARPKSETFGLKFSSKRMLCGLISKCKIFMAQPLCKYSIPRPTPTTI